MTLLRGHFAMTLISAGDASADAIESALAPMTSAGDLTVAVHEVPAEEPSAARGTSWVPSVNGGDRSGIVSSVVAQIDRKSVGSGKRVSVRVDLGGGRILK